MKRMMFVAAMLVALVGNVAAQDEPFVPYSDALAKCSAEWKVSETRRTTPKGEGVRAWNDFRRQCVVEKGYIKGRKKPAQEG